VVWRCGGVVVWWWCGGVVVHGGAWWCGVVMWWWCGGVAMWRCGGVVVWLCVVGQWWCGNRWCGGVAWRCVMVEYGDVWWWWCCGVRRCAVSVVVCGVWWNVAVCRRQRGRNCCSLRLERYKNPWAAVWVEHCEDTYFTRCQLFFDTRHYETENLEENSSATRERKT
jgi:hypothetical protein